MKQQKDNQDEGLKGNEKIEEAILALQHESTAVKAPVEAAL